MRSYLPLLTVALGWYVNTASYAETQPISRPIPITAPQGYTELSRAIGDLDGDGVAETVVAYNTDKKRPNGLGWGWVRELIIYKQKNKTEPWQLWQRSDTALFVSEENGVSDDPFESIIVDQGDLYVHHANRHVWSWQAMDTYSYQEGEFKLVGHKRVSGSACSVWEIVDVNFNTTQTRYEKKFEDCDGDKIILTTVKKEDFYYQNLPEHRNGIHLTLQNRMPKTIIITTPKHKAYIYVVEFGVE